MRAIFEGEQQAVLIAHPNLNHRDNDVTRLAISDSEIQLSSLTCAGYAVSSEPDWRSFREMPRVDYTVA